MKNQLLLACLTALCVAADTNSPIVSTNSNVPSQGSSIPFVELAKGEYSGTNYIAKLYWSDLTNSPQWTGESAPPLSPKKAETLASEYLEKELGISPNVDLEMGGAWRPTDLVLRRFLDWNFWYYEIHLAPNSNGMNFYVAVFVTMNGRVSPLTAAGKAPNHWDSLMPK